MESVLPYMECGKRPTVVPRTLKCPKCGAEVSPEMSFCTKCGASLDMAIRSPARTTREERTRTDVLGLVSTGVILIILGLTYIRNPIEPSVVINYLESMGKSGTFIKPPAVLFDAAIYFLYAAGAWGIVLSGLRVVFQRSTRKAFEDLFGAFFSFYFAWLLTNYAKAIFSGRVTLAYFIVGIGLLVIANAIVHFALPRRM